MHRAIYNVPVQCTDILSYMSNFARKWYTLRHPESSAPDITGLSVEAAITVL